MPLIKIVRSNWHHSFMECQQRINWVWLGKSQREVISFKKIIQAKTYCKSNKNTCLAKVSKITAVLDPNQHLIAGSIGKYNYQGE